MIKKYDEDTPWENKTFIPTVYDNVPKAYTI